MKMVNIFEAKAQLSDLIEQAAAGDRIVICKRNQPVAELRPVAPARTVPRPLGLAAGSAFVEDAFFEPLPSDLEDAFLGDVDRPSQAQRVAEPRAVNGAGSGKHRRTPRR